MTEFVRARSPEHKQQRRDAILAAARQLATESGVNNVSLGNLATAVGLAKSNLVRYFDTREEIFLELAGECWHDWRDAVLEQLRAEDATVVDILVETLDARPLFCDLLTHSASSLEHNVSPSAVGNYKHIMVTVLCELGTAVARAHPHLTDSEGLSLVSAAIGLVSSTYPASNPPATLVEAYRQNPDIRPASPRFQPTMKHFLSAIAAGLPALRS
jgi:AcrR family transcriptional regulator